MVGSGCIWGGLALLPALRDFVFTREEMDWDNAAFVSRFSGSSPTVFRALNGPSFLKAPEAWPEGLPWGDNPPTPAEVANVLDDGLFVGAVGRKNITRNICLLALWCAGVDTLTLHSTSTTAIYSHLHNAVRELRQMNGFNLFAQNVDLAKVPFRSWGFKEEDAEDYGKLYTTPYTVPQRLLRPMFTLQGWVMVREGMLTRREGPRVTRLHTVREH